MLLRFHRSCSSSSPTSDKKKKKLIYEESLDLSKLDKTFSKSNQKMSRQNPFDLYTSFKDALEYLEPNPVSPPDYSTLAQSSPRFPVYNYPNEGHEELPNYTPTIYKLDKFVRKLEWVSPYDPSPTRHWKDVIIELNSTQLNIYYLENYQKNFVNHLPTLPDHDVINTNYKPSINDCKSSLTTIRDLSNVIQFEKFRILKKENLIKSYSLQHAKIGLAQDYKKHKYTLRLRCETEQFLIQFPDLESMIEWNMGLCLGRDNALDLNKRSMPHYRTVPRRRHHHGYDHYRRHRRHRNRRRNNSEPDILHRSRNNSVSNFFHRRRAISSPNFNDVPSSTTSTTTATTTTTDTGLKSRVSSLLLSRHAANVKPANDLVPSRSSLSSSNSHLLSYEIGGTHFLVGNNNEDNVSIQSGSPAEISEVSTRVETTRDDDFYRDDDDDEDDDDEEDFEIHALEDDDDEEDDSDEEADDSIEEEDEEMISTIPQLPPSYNGADNLHSTTTTTDESHLSTTTTTRTNSDDIDLKWYPEFEKLPSRKKIVKDAIRCMSTLSTTDQWCGRNIVKAFDFDKAKLMSGHAHHYHKLGHKNVHNHLRFVKEYVVTSSGLIPIS